MSTVAGYHEVVRDPITRRLLVAAVVSILGDFVGAGALLILAFERAGGLAVGAAGFVAARGAGCLAVALVGGAALDRVPRRAGLIGFELVGAFALLLPLVIPTLWPTYAAAFILGVGSSATVAIRHGVLADAVPERLRGGLLGLLGSTDQFSQAIGYAAGASLAVGIGTRIALGVDIVTFVIAAVVLVGLTLPPRRDEQERASLAAGWKILLAHPQLRLLTFLIIASAAASAIPETLATLAVGSDSPWLPVVMAAGPTGGVVGYVVAGRLASTSRFAGQLTRLSLYAAVTGLGVLIAQPLGFVLVNVGIGAFAASWFLGPQVAFIRLTPPARISQVMAVIVAVIMVAEGSWVLLAGALADAYGVAVGYGMGAAVVAAGTFGGWWVHLRRGDDRHRWDPAEDVRPTDEPIPTDISVPIPTRTDEAG